MTATGRGVALRVTSALLSLVAGECLFRAVFPLPEIANFNRIDYSELLGGVQDQPPLMNASVLWMSELDGVSQVHSLNFYGFRDGRTWCVRRDPAERRVMFMGDSFVEGMMVERRSDDTPLLRARAMSVPSEVMNLGMGGTGLESYIRLAAVAVPLFRPDRLILILYANDLPPPTLEPAWLQPSFQPSAFRKVASPDRSRHVARLQGRVIPRRWHTARSNSSARCQTRRTLSASAPRGTNPSSSRTCCAR